MEKINQTDKKNNLCFFLSRSVNELGENMYAPFLPFFAASFLNINPAQYGFIEGTTLVIYLALSRYYADILKQLGGKIAFVVGYLLIGASRFGLSLAPNWIVLFLFRGLKQTGQVAADYHGQFTGRIFKTAVLAGLAAGPFLGLFFLSTAGYYHETNRLPELSFRWLFMWTAIPSLLGAWIIWLLFKEQKDLKTPTAIIPPVAPSPSLANVLKSFFSNKPAFYLALSHFFLSLAAVPLPMILFYIYREMDYGLTEGLIVFIAYFAAYFAAVLYLSEFIINRLGRGLSHLLTGILCAGVFFLILLGKSLFLLTTAMVLYGLVTAVWEQLCRSEQKWLSAFQGTLGRSAPDIFYGLTGFLSPVLLGMVWMLVTPRFAFVIMVIFCAISIIFLSYSQRLSPDEKS